MVALRSLAFASWLIIDTLGMFKPSETIHATGIRPTISGQTESRDGGNAFLEVETERRLKWLPNIIIPDTIRRGTGAPGPNHT